MSSISLVLALAVPVAMAGLAPPPQRSTAPPLPLVAAPPVQSAVPGAAVLPQQLTGRALDLLRKRVEQERAAIAALDGTVRRESRIVCGTQLHEVDPATDPKIIVPRAERSPEPKVRRVTPTACHEPR